MILRIIYYIVALAFGGLTILQLTNASTLLWGVVYAMAATLTILSLYKKIWWVMPAGLALGCGFAAVMLAEQIGPNTSYTATIEGRQLLGVCGVSLWMGILMFINRAATIKLPKRPTRDMAK